MLRPLIAPSTSPISRAFEVPIACPQVPHATPRATGSAILKRRQRIRAKVLQKIPATLTIIIVRAARPPFCSVKRNVFFVPDFKNKANSKNKKSVGNNSAHDSKHDCKRIFTKFLELTVKRNCESDCYRRHKIIQKIGAF